MSTGEQDVRDLERDVEVTRERVDRDLDELRERLSLNGLLDEAAYRLRRNSDEIGEQLGVMGRNLWRVVRDNPVPFLVIVGGAAWLALAGSRNGPAVPRRALAEPAPRTPAVHPTPAGPRHPAPPPAPVRTEEAAPAAGIAGTPGTAP